MASTAPWHRLWPPPLGNRCCLLIALRPNVPTTCAGSLTSRTDLLRQLLRVATQRPKLQIRPAKTNFMCCHTDTEAADQTCQDKFYVLPHRDRRDQPCLHKFYVLPHRDRSCRSDLPTQVLCAAIQRQKLQIRPAYTSYVCCHTETEAADQTCLDKFYVLPHRDRSCRSDLPRQILCAATQRQKLQIRPAYTSSVCFHTETEAEDQTCQDKFYVLPHRDRS